MVNFKPGAKKQFEFLPISQLTKVASKTKQFAHLASLVQSYDPQKEIVLGIQLENGRSGYTVASNDKMSPQEGCVIGSLIGATEVKLTQAGNEGGVDFFASLCHQGSSHIFSGAYCPMRIVGQSKKYASPVQVDKVKEFVTTLNDVRSLRTSVKDHIPPWFILVYSGTRPNYRLDYSSSRFSIRGIR